MRLDEQTLQKLRNFFAVLPVKKAYVFGSFARGEADEASDLDLLLELDLSRPIGWDFSGWWVDLELLLKRKADLVTDKGLSKHVKLFVDRDKTLIYVRPQG